MCRASRKDKFKHKTFKQTNHFFRITKKKLTNQEKKKNKHKTKKKKKKKKKKDKEKKTKTKVKAKTKNQSKFTFRKGDCSFIKKFVNTIIAK